MITIQADRHDIFYVTTTDTHEEFTLPSWVTHDELDGKYYFTLNATTRELFKRDFLHDIKTKELSMSCADLGIIAKFVQNPKNQCAPDEYTVPQGITLMPHQAFAAELIRQYKKFAFFMGTGTGKTMVAIVAMMTHMPKNVLIVTPKNVIQQYSDEIVKYIQDEPYSNIDIELINFEQLDNAKASKYEMLIVDESHRAKNFMSDTNKHLRLISQYSDYVYIFTGTPMDKSRHDILPQLAILDDRVMPVKGRIYGRYFTMNQYFQPDKEKPAFSEELTNLIDAYSWGIRTEDALPDLPDENILKVMCTGLPPEYDEMRKNRIIECVADGVRYVASAESKATLRLKLRELCAGFYIATNELCQSLAFNVKNPKAVPLRNTLLKCKRGIISYEFEHDLEVIKFVIERGTSFRYSDLPKSIKKQREVLKAFKDGEIDFLVLQSRSGGVGLDLSQTNNLIFYTLPEAHIIYQQMKGRIRRKGQTADKCNYYHLLCEKSVEVQQYSALLKKQDFNNQTFKIWE